MHAAVSWYLLSGFHAAGHQPGHGTTTPNPSSLSLYRTSRRVWQQVTCLERFWSKCWVWDFFCLFPSFFHSFHFSKHIFWGLLRGTVQKRPFVRMLHSAHRIASWPKAFWSEGQALTNLNCTLIYIIHWYTCILDLHNSASFVLPKLESWGLHRSSLALEGSLFAAPLPQTFAGLLEAQSCWEAQIEGTPR